MLELFGNSELYLNALIPCGHTYSRRLPVVAVLRTTGSRAQIIAFRYLLGYRARSTQLRFKRGGVAWLPFPMCMGFVSNNLVTRRWNCCVVPFQLRVGPGHEVSCLLQPTTVGYNNFLSVSLPGLFPLVCRLECPSDHDRHRYACHV